MIDTNAMGLLEALRTAGYHAYFVGGAVRDLLLGTIPKDFDIVTNATPYQIKRVIPGGKIIGRRFRHVLLEKGHAKYEIITFRASVSEEKSAASKLVKQYPDLNQFGNAQEDAFRRDFTINALFYDPVEDELIDYVGGKKDVEKKILRAIGEPMVRLKNDPIRILRAIRHKTKLSLNYEADLNKALTEIGKELRETSKDRIREEFYKVCVDKSIGDFLVEAKKLSILHFFAPWFEGVESAIWKDAVALWKTFHQSKDIEPSFVLGIAVMLAPVAEKTILEEASEEKEENPILDIKSFVHSDTMRSWLMLDLRISKLQTDSITRACFYASRMTGHWLKEGGVPEKIESKISQQTGVQLGACIAKLMLESKGKECPSWILNITKEQGKLPLKKSSYTRSSLRTSSRTSFRDKTERKSFQSAPTPTVRLPILEKPLNWNGPLHAPVLRPTFNDESTIQSIGSSIAYRVSGVPIPPIDKSLLYADVAKSYKPELVEKEEEVEHVSEEKEEENTDLPIRSIREEIEDDIGNRIESPPTHNQIRQGYLNDPSMDKTKTMLTTHERQVQRKEYDGSSRKKDTRRKKPRYPSSRNKKPYQGRKPRSEN